MGDSMFCFQCEQTAGCAGCTGARGVCGKDAATASLQDRLNGALITLAGMVDGTPEPATAELVMEGLFTCVTNVNFDAESVAALTDRVHDEEARLAGAVQPDYDLERIWQAPQDVRSLKSLVLFGLRGIAAYAWHAHVLGHDSADVSALLCRGLAALADEGLGQEELVALAMDAGKANLEAMELLDGANTGTFGTPAPATVPMKVERGPFIVVSGHDLHDLAQLLEQTQGTGVSVYTHGEMLPAHGYPELAKYGNLKGNFGSAWQNQQKEFDGIPAPVLFTTNCLMPPRESYADRVFTTGPVRWPGAAHISAGADGSKDFRPVIDKALELGGFAEDVQTRGKNGGVQVTTGFGRDAVLANAGVVVEAVKSGAIRHFFLVGGCDGARSQRSYFTDFVKATPEDTVVLTLGCGKYRFNDLDLGQVGGLPRLLDVGQCNDAYGAVRIALALADAFECGVNDLPLSLVVSWYEQKAVAVLLTLLYLGIKNVYLGPTLPAFASPAVVDFLSEEFGVKAVGDVDADMAAMLA